MVKEFTVNSKLQDALGDETMVGEILSLDGVSDNVVVLEWETSSCDVADGE